MHTHRHRPVTIHLTQGGMIQVVANDHLVIVECCVEELESEVQALPRKSSPKFNAVHLCFPPKVPGKGGRGMLSNTSPDVVRVHMYTFCVYI